MLWSSRCCLGRRFLLRRSLSIVTSGSRRLEERANPASLNFGVIVAVVFPEFLPKFSEAGFARSSSLRDPLVTIDRLRLSKKRRPKQHRDDQSISHVLISRLNRTIHEKRWTALYIGAP